MTEAEWLAEDHPREMLEYREDTRYIRQWQLFLCACARRQWRALGDEQLRSQVELHEARVDRMVPDSSVEDAEMALAKRFGDHAWYGIERSAQECAIVVVRGTGLRRVHFNHALEVAIGVYDAAAKLSGSPDREYSVQADLIRDIFGNPFRPVTFSPFWLSETVTSLAHGIYADRAFDRLPILADALQEAGCEDEQVLTHCRGDGPHARGCWVVDGVLGKT